MKSRQITQGKSGATVNLRRSRVRICVWYCSTVDSAVFRTTPSPRSHGYPSELTTACDSPTISSNINDLASPAGSTNKHSQLSHWCRFESGSSRHGKTRLMKRIPPRVWQSRNSLVSRRTLVVDVTRPHLLLLNHWPGPIPAAGQVPRRLGG